MAFYQHIRANARPFPLGVDENDRTMFSCNYEAQVTGPADEFEKDLVKKLVDKGIVAGWNVDVFKGLKVVLPSNGGPFSTIVNTGGFRADQTRGAKPGFTTYENLSFQVITRGRDYKATETVAVNIQKELDGIRNETLTH